MRRTRNMLGGQISVPHIRFLRTKVKGAGSCGKCEHTKTYEGELQADAYTGRAYERGDEERPTGSSTPNPNTQTDKRRM